MWRNICNSRKRTIYFIARGVSVVSHITRSKIFKDPLHLFSVSLNPSLPHFTPSLCVAAVGSVRDVLAYILFFLLSSFQLHTLLFAPQNECWQRGECRWDDVILSRRKAGGGCGELRSRGPAASRLIPLPACAVEHLAKRSPQSQRRCVFERLYITGRLCFLSDG